MSIKIFTARFDKLKELEKEINSWLEEKKLALDLYDQEFTFLETHVVCVVDY